MALDPSGHQHYYLVGDGEMGFSYVIELNNGVQTNSRKISDDNENLVIGAINTLDPDNKEQTNVVKDADGNSSTMVQKPDGFDFNGDINCEESDLIAGAIECIDDILAGGDGTIGGNQTVGGFCTIEEFLNVAGDFTAGGTKSFRIDHPFDPENKYLFHAAMESNEVLNQYSGNVTTDSNGNARVELPDYFEEINIDFRYQLTVVGQFAQAIISEEISDNEFVIQTDEPNVRVSWQVTARRNDTYMRENPFSEVIDK